VSFSKTRFNDIRNLVRDNPCFSSDDEKAFLDLIDYRVEQESDEDDLASFIKEQSSLDPDFKIGLEEAKKLRASYVSISKIIETLDDVRVCGDLSDKLKACEILVNEGWVK
jgi:hypothetical protein